jgi:single-strand DNA-binding protein
MFDTTVTIVGNVITAPEWRRTTRAGTLVANFKVASNSRKFDKDSGQWVDGDSLRVRVTCWRRLAEGVASSLMVGDPVMVTGRMYSRDWLTEDGQRRVSYELEAAAVGHDLSRGRGKFIRNGGAMATSSIEDAESDRRIAGQPSVPIDDHLRATEEEPPDGRDYDDLDQMDFDPSAPGIEEPRGNEAGTNDAGTNEAGTNRAGTKDAGLDESGIRTEQGTGDEDDAESSDDIDADGSGSSTSGLQTRRGRRGRSRVAVPA